ncbi:ribosome-associated translation inhibitor RaiA [Patescibacteria group bacterium]|nr:ribosome-associated translation inhibitor RaiA [Patescibacteria group bacterium]
MNIKIRSKNFDLTPAIEEYVTKKISTLEKFLDANNALMCEVEIGKSTNHHKSGDIFKAEVNITQPDIKQVFVVAEEADLYTAIDIVRDEAERAIVSRKNKRFRLLRKGGAAMKSILKRINIKSK